MPQFEWIPLQTMWVGEQRSTATVNHLNVRIALEGATAAFEKAADAFRDFAWTLALYAEEFGNIED